MKIEKILQQHPIFNFAADCREICSPLALLDIVYFSHAHIDLQNQMTAIGNVPEFAELYIKKGYYNYDYHMEEAKPGERYLIWDAMTFCKETQALDEDFMSFNQGHTFSIMVDHEAGKDVYHFATRLGNVGMNGKYLQMLDSLKQFISYFKDKVAAHPGLSKWRDCKLPLSTKVGAYQLSNQSLNLDKFNILTQGNRIYSLTDDAYLTKREVDCLQWLAQGKTFEETAIILGITTRTVKAHITAIKEKTGCTSQFQLGMNFAKLDLS